MWIRERDKLGKEMGKEHIIASVEESMKGNTWMERNKVKVLTRGQMEQSLLENGKMIKGMVKEQKLILTVESM